MSEIVSKFLTCVAAYRGDSLSGTVLMTYTRGESSSGTQL